MRIALPALTALMLAMPAAHAQQPAAQQPAAPAQQPRTATPTQQPRTASPFGGLAQQLGGGAAGGGALAGGMPSLANLGIGNAAGLVSYCVQNQLLQGANANAMLARLTGQRGVAQSPGFEAGRQGTVQAGDRAFSLANVGDQVKGQLCNAALRRGASLLGPR